jgi:NAD-dependent SIR2 family protein deacetylase
MDEPLLRDWLDIFQRNQEILESEYPPEIWKKVQEKVARIEVTDEEIKKLKIDAEKQICFLLGAGASAPAPSSIPTVSGLLPELWRRARKLGRDDIDALAGWCSDHRITNIEDLLTAAYLANFASKNSAVTGLIDYFLYKTVEEERSTFRGGSRARRAPQVDTSSIALIQDTLQVLFGLLTGTMIPADPNDAHSAIVSFTKRHSKVSIVTTNYDGCIDEAMIRSDLPIHSYISTEEGREEPCVDLLKLHGSINWSYCDSCHDVHEFDLLEQKNSYLNDRFSYAVIGICRRCGGQRRPLLIPPIGLKFIMFPNLIRLWEKARTAIEDADLIVVVGFSFAEADNYINKIIERSMSVTKRQSMIVCDPNPRLVSLLRDRFIARIDGFERTRILTALGSAEKVLPEVLETLVPSVEKPTSRTKQKANKSLE